MKKLDGIYNQVVTKENLYRAAYFAARSRRYRPAAADFNFKLEEEIGQLHRELSDKTYRHGSYRLFTIYEPKERLIAAAPFRDRVVHHAVHDVIEPVIDRTFIYDSYACRNNKGMHKAVDRAQVFLRANRFCLHADIRKYFPSIDHCVLKGIIRQRIQDKDVLWLLDEIIDSAPSVIASLSASLRGREAPEAIPEKRDCFARLRLARNDNKIGLPIGNLTSQFFANLYLNELDYFAKQQMGLRYYIRYMDDFLVFSNDKPSLRNIKDDLRGFLRGRLGLRLHEEKSQIYETSNGLKFLGFRLYDNYRRLTTRNIRSFRKQLKLQQDLLTQGSITPVHLRDSVRCWTAHSRYADTGGLRLSIFNEIMERDALFGRLVKDSLFAGGGGGVVYNWN